MSIENIPTPTFPEWVKLYNTYDPEHYMPGKRVSAEEWNTLFLASVRQGNYNADTIELLVKQYLPDTYQTIADFDKFAALLRGDFEAFKTQSEDTYNTFTTQIQKDFTDLSGEVEVFKSRVIHAEDVAFSLDDTIQAANQYAQQAVSIAEESNTVSQNALDTADAAVATSDTALSTAENADATSQTALSDAQEAVTTANAAATQSTQAVNTANAASLRADDAIVTANAAKVESASAKSVADTAAANSTTALNTSQEAKNIADTAEQIAQNALDLVTEGVGSQVLVNGVAVDTFDADTKADVTYVNQKIDDIMGPGSTEAIDTILELAEAFKNNSDVIKVLNESISTKANTSDLDNYLPLSAGPYKKLTGDLYAGVIYQRNDKDKFVRVANAEDIPTNYVTTDTAQDIEGYKRFIAPTNIAGTEQITTKINTSNGGSIRFGKQAANSGSMIRLDQEDGTCRLRFRASKTTGAMVWEQPEAGAMLYFDLGDRNSDYRRITMPSSAGTLAVTSDLSAVTDATLSDDNKTLTVTKRDGSSFDFQGGSDLSDYVKKSTDNTLSGNLVWSNSSAWLTPYLLAFKNADTSQSPTHPYTGFYQWGNEWQVNARDANNKWAKNLMTINLDTAVATFATRPTVNASPIALQSDLENYVTTDTTQTISGAKTFSSSTTKVNARIEFTSSTNPGIKMGTSDKNFYIQSSGGMLGIGPYWANSTKWDSSGNVVFNKNVTINNWTMAQDSSGNLVFSYI